MPEFKVGDKIICVDFTGTTGMILAQCARENNNIFSIKHIKRKKAKEPTLLSLWETWQRRHIEAFENRFRLYEPPLSSEEYEEIISAQEAMEQVK